MIRWCVVLSLVAVVLAGCADNPSEDSDTRKGFAGQERIIVTREDPSALPRCRPESVARRLIRFSAALNTADLAALRPIWGRGFEFFSVTGSPSPEHQRHFVARDADKALAYVHDRRGFRLQLAEIEITDYRGPRGADITYDGIWKAPDIRDDGFQVLGKGFISCSESTIKAWAMSVRKQGLEVDAAFCPESSVQDASAADSSTPTKVTVCAPPPRG